MTAAMLGHRVSSTVSIILLTLMVLAVVGVLVTGVAGGETGELLSKSHWFPPGGGGDCGCPSIT